MMIRPRVLDLAAVLSCALLLASCGTAPPPSAVTQASPTRGTYKVGNPYQVDGIWYYPAENPDYDQTGIASWYGPNFYEKYTANGEVFSQYALTAAHKTLPMPSIVEVENLENGRTIQVRINDRGPFVGDRIIDLSYRGAQLLGFDREGTAKVRVRYLLAPSMTAQSIARSGGVQMASLGPPEPQADGAIAAQPLPDAGFGSSPAAPPPPQSYRPAPVAFSQPEPVLPERVTYLPVHPTQIYIQAGAFAMGPNAFRMKARLDALGPVEVTGAVVHGLDVYRVRLGPIATVDQADRLLAQARAAGATEAAIVVN